MDALSTRHGFPSEKARDRGPAYLAADCSEHNFYAIDRGLRDLLPLYLAPRDFARWSRTSIAWAGLPAVGSTSSRASPTSIRRC